MNVDQQNPPKRNPAMIYDELFVPALFAQWGPRVAEAAGVSVGDRVLDVGCGSGVLACAAAERVAPAGHVVGIDPNEQMLAVAHNKRRDVEWQLGRAEALPFSDASFDAVVSQFALMFVGAKSHAIAEMLRVLRPGGGRLAVAVWDAIDQVPGYLALAELLRELFGQGVADAMHAPFSLGDPVELRKMFVEAGAMDAEVQRRTGTVRFPSIDAMISTEGACVWTLGGMLDEQQIAQLHQAASQALQPFVQKDGSVEFACPAQIVSWVKA
jgi:ubiquinone/menaquinone biosynthesis C-methylase UbiE